MFDHLKIEICTNWNVLAAKCKVRFKDYTSVGVEQS